MSSKENAANPREGCGIEEGFRGNLDADSGPTAVARQAHSPDRPFVVVVRGRVDREWGRYSVKAEADRVARQLRGHGFDAVVHDDGRGVPEHRSERRRFIVWAVMLGAAPPARLTERVLAELEDGHTA